MLSLTQTHTLSFFHTHTHITHCSLSIKTNAMRSFKVNQRTQVIYIHNMLCLAGVKRKMFFSQKRKEFIEFHLILSYWKCARQSTWKRTKSGTLYATSVVHIQRKCHITLSNKAPTTKNNLKLNANWCCNFHSTTSIWIKIGRFVVSERVIECAFAFRLNIVWCGLVEK